MRKIETILEQDKSEAHENEDELGYRCKIIIRLNDTKYCVMLQDSIFNPSNPESQE